MANIIQDDAKTAYVAGTDDYLLTTYDHIQNVLGSPKYSQQLPFYISIVDSKGALQSLSMPPVGDPTIINNRAAYFPWRKPENNIMAVRLLVNPASLTVNMSKIVNRTQTMTGWLEEHWGDDLDTISCQGNTAGFVVGKNPTSPPTQDEIDKSAASNDFYKSIGMTDTFSYMDTGITTKYRRSTVSYQEFKKLVDIFQSNGCMFDTQGFVRQRYYIQFNYDYSQYWGYFEAFDIMEDSANPFRISYTLTFKSEKTIYSYSKVAWQNNT